MIPSSVIRRECIPSYVGDVKHPVTSLAFGRPLSCGSQSVVSAVPVSCNIPVITQPIPVVSVSAPELVTASTVEVVSDSSGCSLKVENKCGKHKIAHKCSDKKSVVLIPLLTRELQ